MRLFTTFKTGYTAGTYGCSGEYFTTIIIGTKGTKTIKWHGMYGPEYRVAEYLKKKGYKEFYTSTNYGKLKRDDILAEVTHSEHDMLTNKLPEMLRELRAGNVWVYI